jgi:glutathione S-transferase
MKLVIGAKNYSTWSLRPWLLLRQLGIPFEEEKLSFNDPAFKAKVLRYSPAGKVPLLVDGDVVVWDSLAIVEYVAERFPDHGVWPADRVARARARSVCAEMHSGFNVLRSRLPMNCELQLAFDPPELSVKREIARMVDIWTEARTRFGGEGPFLFGRFSAADAYFAPVVRRFLGHQIALPDVARSYAATIDALPVMQEWVTAARAEHDFYAPDEPFRERPPAK